MKLTKEFIPFSIFTDSYLEKQTILLRSTRIFILLFCFAVPCCLSYAAPFDFKHETPENVSPADSILTFENSKPGKKKHKKKHKKKKKKKKKKHKHKKKGAKPRKNRFMSEKRQHGIK